MVFQVAGVSGRGPELSAGRAGRGARVGEGAGMGGAPARSLGRVGGRARRVAQQAIGSWLNPKVNSWE